MAKMTTTPKDEVCRCDFDPSYSGYLCDVCGLPEPSPSDRGICDLCESAPIAEGDCFCAPCRANTEAISDEVNDPVEHALNKHARFEPLCTEDKTLCRCGAEFSGGGGYHRRHLAEEVYIALRDAGQTVTGPLPWTSGERSPSRERFGGGGRITPDGGWR